MVTGTTAPPTKPGPPVGLTATNDRMRRIDLSWMAPTDDGGADITGYHVEVSADGTNWTNLVEDTGTGMTGFTHTGLRGEDSRHYRVSAINSAGNSDASNLAEGTTAPATAPEAPTALAASRDLERRIDLSWEPPLDDGGADVSGYRIESSQNGVEWIELAPNTGSIEPAYTHMGLRGAAQHHYRISAINSAGVGAASEVAVGATAPATVPEIPMDLSATTNWERWIDLNWAVPSDDGGADILGYRIEFSEDGEEWETLVANTESGGTEFAHLGLEADVMLHYRVSAVNSAGAGPPSESADGATKEATSADDRAVLESFYDATNGENWTRNTNWKTDLPLSRWHGVTTGRDGRVTGLVLQGNRLSGRIVPELGNLTKLKELALTDNNLSGKIPRKLGSLSDLERINLSNNLLSGEIPPELGNLTRLQTIYLSDNQLSGEIPPQLGNLSSVVHFSLSDNLLNGEIPPELGELRKLLSLTLNENQLKGSIPKEIGRLSRLTLLFLWGNQLTGEIPRQLGNLSRLQTLNLGWNRLSGKIPEELGDLFQLDSLSLNNNQLTGNIPEELGNLTRLNSLFLSHNRLDGEVPKALEELTNLGRLRLRGNRHLTGCIPATLWEVERNDLPFVGLESCDGRRYGDVYSAIQGAVTGPNGEPMEGVLIVATKASSELYGGVAVKSHDITAEDGSFLIRMPDDHYLLFIGNDECNFVGAYGPGGFIRYTNEGTQVEVAGADVTDILITLPGDPNELRVTRTSSCQWL